VVLGAPIWIALLKALQIHKVKERERERERGVGGGGESASTLTKMIYNSVLYADMKGARGKGKWSRKV
jgi:hypothetical protein